MELRDYIPRGGRAEFARRIGCSLSYLNKLCSGHERPGIRLTLKIERETGRKVSRYDLRPDLFGADESSRAA